MPPTSPARAANRATSSSARSAGTVIALILTTLTRWPPDGGRQVRAGFGHCSFRTSGRCAAAQPSSRRNRSISRARSSPDDSSVGLGLRPRAGATMSATSGRSREPSSTRSRYASLCSSRPRRSTVRPASSRRRSSSARIAGGDGVAGHVVRHLRPQPDRADAGVAERDLQHASGCRWGRSSRRAARRPPGRPSGSTAVASTLDRSAVRHRCGHPAERDRELHVQPLPRTRPSSAVTSRQRTDGSGPATMTHVPAGDAGDQLDRRPVDPAGHAVDEAHRRPGLLQVQQLGEVDATRTCAATRAPRRAPRPACRSRRARRRPNR